MEYPVFNQKILLKTAVAIGCLFLFVPPMAIMLQGCGDGCPASGISGEAGTPTLTLTSVPALGSSDHLRGLALHVSTKDHVVVVYIHVPGQGWWVKPYADQTTTALTCTGGWEANITTGGNDTAADQIAAYLIPSTYTPPVLLGAAALPSELDANAVAKALVNR